MHIADHNGAMDFFTAYEVAFPAGESRDNFQVWYFHVLDMNPCIDVADVKKVPRKEWLSVRAHRAIESRAPPLGTPITVHALTGQMSCT